MYTITRNIKILSFSLMTLGILGIAYGFYVAPKTIEESKEIIAASHDDSHSSDSHSSDSHGSDSHGSDSHVMSHDEHVFHQLANRPWAALYVAAFFFFMISLGTLAFYAIQRASQACRHQLILELNYENNFRKMYVITNIDILSHSVKYIIIHVLRI